MVNETNSPQIGAEFDAEIADIEIGERLREVDAARAMLVASSMRDRGQMTPILVRRRKGRSGPRYALVAGGHRLAGANILSWTTIKAKLVEGTETELRLAEIDENLARVELVAFDRAKFLAERKRLYEELHPETAHGGDRRSAEFQNDTLSLWSFAKDTAEKCGLTARTIERAVRIATKLTPEVKKRIPGTWLADHQGELLALTKLEPAHQLQALDLLLSPQPTVKTVEAARKVVQGVKEEAKSDTDRQLEKLTEAWARAGAPARRAFIEHLRATGALEQPKLEQVA